MTKLPALLAVVLLLLMVAALWRSRRNPHPCPWWLRWLLENPHMKAVAGPSVLIKRMHLEPGMHLLDIGCGPGRLTIPFARQVGPTGRVIAFDTQERMLQVLRARLEQAHLENVEIVRGRAGEGDIQWESVFDRAVLVTVLGEIPNKTRALQEMLRALKPGGILSVTEVLPDPDYQSRGTVARLAADAGFEFVSRHGNLLAFTLNVRKPASTALKAGSISPAKPPGQAEENVPKTALGSGGRNSA
ncbi:MAG: methyltransferase domain-containing protein [Verrucomicrobia bacterium]|nr:methyltransferase domain-containing protein [Verrucomicrobiota bacterium]